MSAAGGVLDAGVLTARLDLEAATDTPDGQGGAVRSFAAVAALWGRIEPLAVLAGERADERLAEATHRIDLRHRTDIRAGMRLRKGARLFEILAAYDPDETQRILCCRCREVLA